MKGIARATDTLALLPIRILFVEGVAPQTMCLGTSIPLMQRKHGGIPDVLHRCATTHIHLVSNRLKMPWVTAMAYATEMI